MSDTVLIGVAWPYANGEQHIGHIAGAYLPADIFARFERMRGSDVLMVSGSDTHGTPITVRADQEGTTPDRIAEKFHPRFIQAYLDLGLTFDLFTHTDTQNHWDVTQQMFLTHLEKGYIYRDKQQQLFDPAAQRFLPDRYVEGTCPKCGAADARGDQCDTCGATYDAVELINPRSKSTGATNLEARETEHFFFDLARTNEPLLQWIRQSKSHWRPSVLNYTTGQLEQEHLRGRPITRDMTWGINIPVEGYDDKRIYVWYDAVIGYLSATREWANLTGQPEKWRKYWEAPSDSLARSYYFIGKDNIPFHTIIWPAMLLAHGGLNLPYDVPSNEYLNLKGEKQSKSRGKPIEVNDVLSRYQADAWRYALTAMAPEGSDSSFTWEEFVERVNNELLANWGNLANRLISFTYKNFDGRIPEPGEIEEVDRSLLTEIRSGFESVGALYKAVRLKAAMSEVRRLSQRVNQHLNDRAPWKLIKTDRAAAATACYVGLQAIDWLKLLWSPILPHTSQKLHETLGYSGQLFGRQYTEEIEDARGKHLVLRYDHTDTTGTWDAKPLPGGQAMREPSPLIVKLDVEIPAQEEERAKG